MEGHKIQVCERGIAYLNPARTSITIERSAVNGKQWAVKIYDPRGKQLIQSTIDNSTLGSGVYVLGFFDDERQVNRKIVKE